MKLLLSLTSLLLVGCSPVKSPIIHQYQLKAFKTGSYQQKAHVQSILVSPPEAVAGYQTNQMLYTCKPFEISAFAHNSWANPPADMLLPLIVQSLQRAGYFRIVTSSANSEHTDYRVDTQLIELKQNFLKKPSQIDLAIKVVLSNLNQNRPTASRILRYTVTTLTDTPYGGVVAANKAVEQFTADLSRFVRQATHNR